MNASLDRILLDCSQPQLPWSQTIESQLFGGAAPLLDPPPPPPPQAVSVKSMPMQKISVKRLALLFMFDLPWLRALPRL
jgi:hypothetical protein